MISIPPPTSIRLEASSACQLRCPACPTTSRAIQPAVGTGFLRLPDFRNLVDANPQLKTIELSNWGEIFLNPELVGIFQYAYERGVEITVLNGTNFNTVRPEALDALVRYQVRVLKCSIDGATQESYEKYRVRGKLDRVLGNIRELNRLKDAANSPLPHLIWHFVIFGHNQHEIEAAWRMARDLRMDFHVKSPWDDEFSPIVDNADLRRVLGQNAILTRTEFRRRFKKEMMQGLCQQMWDQPQVNFDGRMLGCCVNYWGDFGGNAYDEGLTAAVNSDRMSYARSMLAGQVAAREDIPCSSCYIYKSRLASSDWILPA